MNKKKVIALSICVLGVVGLGCTYIKSKDNSNIKSFEQVYFELVGDIIKEDKITSKEVIKNIENISKKDDSFAYEKTEEKANVNSGAMNVYKFETKKEMLEVSYLKEDDKEKGIEIISYQLKKDNKEPYIGVNYFNQGEGTYLLGTLLYPNNFSEQKEYFDIIQKGVEENKIYTMYYELASYVEDGKSISVEAIENIVGEKAEDIEHDTNDGITTSYTVEKDKCRLTILYNKEENKIFFTSVENTDGINVYCSEDKTEKESKLITMLNTDLDGQRTVLQKISQKK